METKKTSTKNDGRFKKGDPTNRGRPPEGQSLVKTLIKLFDKYPHDKVEIAKKWISLAKAGNKDMIALMANYLDGKPVETRKLEKEERITILFKPAEQLSEPTIEAEFTEVATEEQVRASVS